MELICINCPRGCNLRVVKKEDTVEVEGNFCKQGETYAAQEVVNPVRVLTVLMRVEGASHSLSVKTDKPVPKSMLMECADAIYKVHPKAPVKYGDILIENLCGTGCNVIATSDSE
jgi:CxxC motif-containing protein